MLVLDLFSGLGGFSQAFTDRKHEAMTIDNNKKFNADFDIDISDYEKIVRIFRFLEWDVILASPPCTEFTKAYMPWYKNIVPDMSLIDATKKIVSGLKPKFWIVENVRGAIPYFEPLFGKPKKHCGSRYLWGNFPDFPCEYKKCCGKHKVPGGKLQSETRAKVPYEISLNLCRAIEDELW